MSLIWRFTLFMVFQNSPMFLRNDLIPLPCLPAWCFPPHASFIDEGGFHQAINLSKWVCIFCTTSVWFVFTSFISLLKPVFKSWIDFLIALTFMSFSWSTLITFFCYLKIVLNFLPIGSCKLFLMRNFTPRSAIFGESILSFRCCYWFGFMLD